MKLSIITNNLPPESTTDPEAGNDQTEESDGPVNLIVQEPEIIIETEGTSEIIQLISLSS